MPILNPEIDTTLTPRTPQQPTATIEPDTVKNLGMAMADFILSLQKKGDLPAETPVSSPSRAVATEPKTDTQLPEPQVNRPAKVDYKSSLLNPQFKALMDTISEAEGTSGKYNIIVGGKEFSDFSQHPGIVGVTTKAGPSTAAGKYQITEETWKDYLKKYPDITDFSPESQDKVAFALAKDRYRINTKGRDLETDLASGTYQYIQDSLNTTWTGLKIDKTFMDRLRQKIGG